MAVSAARGTSLTIDTTKVGHLSKISSPSVTTDEVEVTALDNTTGWKEFLLTYKDGGEMSVEGYLDLSDAGQAAMVAAMEDEEAHDFVITFPTSAAAKWTFEAMVKAFATEAETASALTFTATLRVTGAATLAKVTA